MAAPYQSALTSGKWAWPLQAQTGAFQPAAVPDPVMAPNYVYSMAGALQVTDVWDNSGVTAACNASPVAMGYCMDAVVRGGMSHLTPVVGTAGAPETILLEEATFIAAAMTGAGFYPRR